MAYDNGSIDASKNLKKTPDELREFSSMSNMMYEGRAKGFTLLLKNQYIIRTVKDTIHMNGVRR